MSVRVRVIGAAVATLVVASLSGVGSRAVGSDLPGGASPSPSARAPSVPGNAPLAIGQVADDTVVVAARTETRRTSWRVFDDRKLARRTAKWSSVSAGSAMLGTLSCASAKGQTLRVKSTAAEGGGVLVQTGRGRGSIEIRVGGTPVVRASTAASRTGKRWISFPGAGVVDIRVSTAGKRVCIDAARLVIPQALLPGKIRHLGVNASGAGPNNEVINAEVSPGGTMVAFWSRATNLLPGVNDGRLHLFIANTSTGRVTRVVDTSQSGVLSNDASSSDGSRALAWSPIFRGDADARYIAFGSSANNLGPDPGEGWGPFLYVKDLKTGSVTFLVRRVSEAAWSPDGNKIAFVTGFQYGSDPGSDNDIWAYDLTIDPNGANLWDISTTSSGQFTSGSPNGSFQPSWSPDATRVMFTSWSSGLVANDSNASRDIFTKDLRNGSTKRVSLGRSGVQANSYSEHGTWSPDGRLIAFTSAADNLVPGDTNSGTDVFVRELSSGRVALVSTTSRGEPSLFDHYRPHWSPDQSRIAFMSEGVDLLPRTVDSNQRVDVYIKNLVTGLNQIVSITPDKRFGNAYSSTFMGGFSNNAWLPNGKGVVFLSRSTNLASSDRNNFSNDVFLKVL
jgi:Tol biopolymer transport system component